MIEFISRLPQGYQEVEYIESSGIQYIDTGYKPTSNNLRITCEFEYTAEHSTSSVFGSESSSKYSIVPYGAPAFYVGSSVQLLVQTTALNTKYALDAHANAGTLTVLLNGITNSASYSGSILTTVNIGVFCNIIAGVANQFCSMKLYAMYIYDNGNLVRDFVPCYRKSDNVAGLYDLVNNVFYTNAGSGVFAVGADSNKRAVATITPGGVIPMQYALRRRMMIKCDSKIEFEYTGNYTDNRDENGVGTVRFTSSGTLTVLSGKATVSAYVLGAGGGGAFDAYNYNHFYHASGGSGGYQTVEVELTPGTYDVVIGVGGAGVDGESGGNIQGRKGGDTTAFGTVSTGGNGGKAQYGGYGGTGGTPNGNSGSFVDTNSAVTIAGGSPNGGQATQWASKNRGGKGYVEITFS